MLGNELWEWTWWECRGQSQSRGWGNGHFDHVKPQMRMLMQIRIRMILVVMGVRMTSRSPAAGETTDGEGELYPQCDQLPGDPGGQVLFLIGWICFKYLRTNKCLEIFQTVTVYITIPDCQETFRIVWELSTLYKHCLDCLSWYSRNFQDCLDCLTTFQIVKKLSGKSENFQDCPESKSTQMHYYPPQKWLPSLSSERRATWTVLQGLTWWSWPLKCLRASETRCCPSQRHGFKF